MQREYDPLPLRELGAGAGLRRPTQRQALRVSAESPALEVMTDLGRVSPATIRPNAPLAGANRFMITRGVRLLLVVDEDHETVLGVITATDILGERPMLAATGRGLRRDELTVADVMTPAAEVQALDLDDVEISRVGHVVETLRRAGRQHALVVDRDSMVRGIFSLSQIGRQLGITLPAAGETALTFSQIEAALAK
ncbi:MAG TPA: CBS domain-containing protein [Burkholderiales bacterium]